MTIHKVKKPFFCRNNQFAYHGYPGQILVVGIANDALQGEVYRMTIGKNPTTYVAPVSEIKRVGSPWKNKAGKLVIITPVDLFKKII